MSSSGPNSAGTLANDGAVGTAAWNNPGNAAASDNSRATGTSISITGQDTHYLKATNFGFSVSGTIDGITVEIERSFNGSGGNSCQDNIVRLVIGGTVSGTNKADTGTNWPVAASEAYATYGGAADLWGLTPADTDINGSTFGVVISANGTVLSPKANCVPQVDHIRITITYTAAGGSGQPTTKRFGGVTFAGVRAPAQGIQQWTKRLSGLSVPAYHLEAVNG